MSKMILVTTTFDKREDALYMANLLLEKRLIACAQISSPVESLYRWQGTIEQTIEYKLLLKSEERLWKELHTEITSSHPYDIPEIIATPVIHVNNKYGNWLSEEL